MKHLNLLRMELEKMNFLKSLIVFLGLNNINLNIRKAKIQVVMGFSGSGKSTLNQASK